MSALSSDSSLILPPVGTVQVVLSVYFWYIEYISNVKFRVFFFLHADSGYQGFFS